MTFGSKAIIAHRQALRQSPVWRETEDLLRTVPGVGEQVFLTLLAYLSELGHWTTDGSPPSWGWAPPTGTAAPCGATHRLWRTRQVRSVL